MAEAIVGYEYPTEDQLQRVEKWDLKDPEGLIAFIHSLWWMPDWGFKIEKKDDVLSVELHTGGWSGNESIIDALQENMIWHFSWETSKRGGHYWLEFRLNQFR
jgi:hypothetical protein